MLELVNGLYLFGVGKGVNSPSVTNRANGTYTDQLLGASRVLYIYGHGWQAFHTSNRVAF